MTEHPRIDPRLNEQTQEKQRKARPVNHCPTCGHDFCPRCGSTWFRVSGSTSGPFRECKGCKNVWYFPREKTP